MIFSGAPWGFARYVWWQMMAAAPDVTEPAAAQGMGVCDKIARCRGRQGPKDAFLLAATAQSLRKMAKIIPMPTQMVPA